MTLSSRSLVRITSTTKGTVEFWAPELYDYTKGNVHQTKESDVWAFGMTVFVRLTHIFS